MSQSKILLRCVEIQKEITNEDHTWPWMLMFYQAGSRTLGKAYDWDWRWGDSLGGQVDLGLAWHHCRACRLDTSLIFSLPPGSPLRLRRDNYGARIHIRVQLSGVQYDFDPSTWPVRRQTPLVVFDSFSQVFEF